jgi:hypothetical protein
MEKYINALYFALTTMVTIGYGDIKGVTTAERICTIAMMVIGAGLYAFNLNDISHIVGNYNMLANQYK